MKHFEFKLSANPKIIGRRVPQISNIVNWTSYETEEPNSITRINPWTEVASDLIVPNYFLHGHAKLTDLLSQGSHHSHLMLISNKLRQTLEKSKLPSVQAFKTTVLSKGKSLDYCLFYIPGNFVEFIDFEKSTFCIAKSIMRTKMEPVEINSLEQFRTEEAKFPRPHGLCVAVEKLVFAEDKIPYDMFRILGAVNGYFASEELKNAMEKAGCTGMEFVPVEKVETVFYR